jgi:hypothetical protein
MKQIHEERNRELNDRDLASALEIQKYNRYLKDCNNMLSSATTGDAGNV